MSIPPILVFGYGNPGRGDDALGPELAAALEQEELPEVECQTDMQLQVEHVTDLAGRRQILFVDADASCKAPFVLESIQAEKDSSYTSHAMTPEALLHAFRQVYGREAPPALLLRVRGEAFELGAPLSPAAAANYELALQQLRSVIDGMGEIDSRTER